LATAIDSQFGLDGLEPLIKVCDGPLQFGHLQRVINGRCAARYRGDSASGARALGRAGHIAQPLLDSVEQSAPRRRSTKPQRAFAGRTWRARRE
jgi:hypothetical protein